MRWKRHTKTDVEGGANVAIAMKDDNGNRVNVAKADNMPQDLTGIAINVDNFQEAYDFFSINCNRFFLPASLREDLREEFQCSIPCFRYSPLIWTVLL